MFKGVKEYFIYAPNLSVDKFEGTNLKKAFIIGHLKHLEIEDVVTAQCKDEYISYLKSHKAVCEAFYVYYYLKSIDIPEKLRQ